MLAVWLARLLVVSPMNPTAMQILRAALEGFVTRQKCHHLLGLWMRCR